jgi:hypothetical protein
MRFQRVRGLELDGTAITMTIGRYQFDVLKSSYGDSLNVEKLRQMGHQAIDAITPGIYETDDGKISMSESVFRGEFMPLVEQYGFGNTIHPITFSFTNPYTGSDSDLLLARIVGITGSNENTAKPSEKEFKLVVQQIYWTDDRKTIERMGDVYAAPGLSRL